MICVRPIAAHEWPIYRDLRLKALKDSPDAFGSTWQAEVQRADENWSAQIAAATSGNTDRALFAIKGEQVCGLVWCKLSETGTGNGTETKLCVADIYQMWVDPAARGLGAGHALLTQALAWAQSRGARRVRLGVTAADSPAMRLYQSQGFCSVGGLAPLREDSELMAQAMELDWGPVASS